MMDISLSGLIGAIVGTVAAAVLYHLFIGRLELKLREREPMRTAEDRDRLEAKLSVMRRAVLATDLFLFAGLGYWLGHQAGG
jgi:hypothetical protein